MADLVEETVNAYVNKIEFKTYETLKHISYLDEYDFSEFLTEGRSLLDLISAIENKYDKEFKQKYGFYMFDGLDLEIIRYYLISRYNINFQEYSDWVVRKQNGAYEKTRKWIEVCS